MIPKISIIVPVYNVEKYLRTCIDSILHQTFIDHEIILVDDGSPDNCGKICDEYEKVDRRVKVIHKKNGGLSSARNAGIEIARGEYLGFVDSDDLIDKDMYKRLHTLCIDTGSDISICNFGQVLDSRGSVDKQQEIVMEMDNIEAMRQLFTGVYYRFSVCNKLFNRKCFENIRFPEGRIHEDLSIAYKLFAKAHKTAYSNFTGYYYIKRENSILTSNYNVKRLDAFISWAEILPFMDEKYIILSNEYIACFAYGCVDHIYYILNQVESNRQRLLYIRFIQQIIRKYYKIIMGNDIISFKTKITISLINYQIGLLLYLNRSMKLLKLN